MPHHAKRADAGRGPKGVSSPCGLITVTLAFSSMPVSSRQARAQNDAGKAIPGSRKPLHRAGLQVPQRVADLHLGVDVDAFQNAALGLHRARQKDRPVERRRHRRDDMRQLADSGDQIAASSRCRCPASFSCTLMCAVAPSRLRCSVLRKPLLMASATTSAITPAATPTMEISGDDGDHGFLAARPQIAARRRIAQKRGWHGSAAASNSRRRSAMPMSPSGRSSGNRMTSRMDFEPVRSMVRRSMPMPSPPVGGMP